MLVRRTNPMSHLENTKDKKKKSEEMQKLWKKLYMSNRKKYRNYISIFSFLFFIFTV